MRMRFPVHGWLLVLALVPCLAASARAGTEYHIKQGVTDPANKIYPSLDALRQAMAPPLPSVNLNNGDAIVLHNDDMYTLTDGFVFQNNLRITIRSADGNKYVIKGQPSLAAAYLFQAGEYITDPASQPQITLENVHVLDNANVGGVVYLAGGNNAGLLNITNSIFENNGGGVDVMGNATVNITNTSFLNNGTMNGITAFNLAGESTVINLAVDANGPRTVKWESTAGSTGISIWNGGSAAINADVAYGKNLDIRGTISNLDLITPNALATLTKTGGGVMKLWNGGGGNMNIDIKEGTLQFGPNSYWITDIVEDPTDATDTSTNNTITVRSQGVLKVGIDPGNIEEYYQKGQPDNMAVSSSASRFIITRFLSEEGARTEIGGISKFPVMPITQTEDGSGGSPGTTWTLGYSVIGVTPGTVNNSTFASTMNINNSLLTATWKSGDGSKDTITEAVESPIEDHNVWFLHIEKVNNLATLDGVGSYADVYRRLDTLTEEERDALDHIYATGAAGGAELGHLQTLGGVMVQNSMVAMRHNYNNLWRHITQRATKFQREELELDVSGSDYCYSEEDPSTKYGEIWAYIDQAWYDQDDIGDTAGYRYNPYGIGIGYEKHKDEWIFGAVARYDTGDMKLKSHSATHTDIDTVLLSAYASYATQGYYITGGAHFGYGWNNATSSYTMPGLVATGKSGDFSTSLYGLSAEGGYMMSTGSGDYPLRVTPYAGLGYARISREAFTETGAGNLNRTFRKSDWDMWEFTAGVRLAMPIERENYILIPSADISFVRTMGEAGGNDVTLVSNPAGTWKADVMSSDRSALHISAGLNARFGNNWDVGMGYDFEWRKRGINNQLNLNMTKGF